MRTHPPCTVRADSGTVFGISRCIPHMQIYSWWPGLKISVGHGLTDIVRPIREIVRRREETTGHSVRPTISETEVYCLSDPSELVSDRTVDLSDVNQNVKWKIRVLLYKR
jgi:hypothetical protein